jgi:hypothetical protein
MTMFEVRILCRRLLPKSVNDLDDKIISSDNSLISTKKNNNNNNNVEQQILDKKHLNQIRDYKRQSLAKTLETYELNIEENECLYQEELLRLFDNELFKQQSDQIENFMNCLNNYLKHGTDTGIRKIRYKETVFRTKLNHPRHRYSQPPSSVADRAMNVYPEAIIEVKENHHPFTDKELALLSSAGTYSFFNAYIYFFFVITISSLRRTKLYKI